MSLLELILIFVLQFGGISAENIVYKTPGHDVTLSCDRLSSANLKCSDITWLYNRDPSATLEIVQSGKVNKDSPQAARLSLKSDCSLFIKNITADDVGRYGCRLGNNPNQDITTHLSVLTISPSTPDGDGEVILDCSLWRYAGLQPCKLNSVRWVNETGTVLLGKGSDYEFLGQTNCVSRLKVKLQSGNNRRFTCQVLNKTKVEVQAEYTPVSLDNKEEDQGETNGLEDPFDQTYIIMGAAVGLLVVLLVIAAVFIKTRRRTTVTAVQTEPLRETVHHHRRTYVEKPNQHPDETESNLTYVTISHANQRASPKKKVKVEEDVTYSAVKMTVRTEAEHDLSSIYSTVSKPK